MKPWRIEKFPTNVYEKQGIYLSRGGIEVKVFNVTYGWPIVVEHQGGLMGRIVTYNEQREWGI